MFNKNKKSSYLTDNEKMQKRADILYGGNNENKNNKNEIKGELSPLLEMDKKIKTNNKKEKDYSKTADLFYPTMKNKEDKIDSIKPDKKINNEKNINFTGGAANIKIEDKSKKILKALGFNENEYEVKNDVISPIKKKKEFEVINNVKYPTDGTNKKVEELRQNAKKEQSEQYRKDTEKYLKDHAHLYQFSIDNSNNKIIKVGGKFIFGNETMENLEMSKTKSYMNTDYAKQHKIYNNYNEAPDNLKNYFKDKITEQIGSDKLKKTKGIYIDADSESSKRLKNALLEDTKFIEKLKKYDMPMINKYSINESINLKGRKWGNAVGNADIRNMHLKKNGDIELYITDVYDFNEGEKNKLVQIGRNRQDKGEITPYFYAYRVIIPKSEKEKALKGKINDR